MNRAIVHSFTYVFKVWLTAGWVAITLVLVVYAVNRRDILTYLSHPDILFSLGWMFFIQSLMVCSLMLIVVRYITVLKWNTALIKLIVSIVWFGVIFFSTAIMSAILVLLRDIFDRLSIQMHDPYADPILIDIFATVLTAWLLASVLFACCYRIRPRATSESILPE